VYIKPEAAPRIGVSVPTLERLMAAGLITFRRVSRGRVVFTEQDLAEYLERVKVDARGGDAA
jgi:excisionase family DNA binding protein